MTKRINPSYQAKKQRLKNLLDLKDRDREIYFFHKKNPDFPVEFISERLRIYWFIVNFNREFACFSNI